jgi:hypothetical protein
MNAMTLYKGLMVTMNTMGVAGDMAVTDAPRIVFISSRVPAADVRVLQKLSNICLTKIFFIHVLINRKSELR